MADFRRWFLAFAALVLVLGLTVPASAQTNGPQVTCSVSTNVTPTVRSEGLTELVGDILLTCQGVPGGSLITTGNVPQANISVSLSGALSTSTIGGGLDALLLVDDPSPANQDVCPYPTNGLLCPVAADGGQTYNQPGRYNVFQGTPGGPSGAQSITFLGIPVDPPATGYLTYRITNIRIQAPSITPFQYGLVPIYAYVSTSSSTSITITQTTQPIVGYVAPGLTFSASGTNPSLLQCLSYSDVTVGTLTFAEGFANAFKIMNTPGGQTSPGTVYYSESGLQVTLPDGAGVTGLASTATELEAVISNVPSGVQVWVDTSNTDLSGISATLISPTAIAVGDGTTEVLDNESGSPTSVTVVWAITASNPVAFSATAPGVSSLSFNVYTSFTGAPGANGGSPQTSVTAYAQGGFYPQESAWANGGPVPEFVLGTLPASPGQSLFTVSLCQTILLFPYVTDFYGFDTGIAISNTSLDNTPVPASPQTGACSVAFYSGGALSANIGTTGNTPGYVNSDVSYNGVAEINSTGLIEPGQTWAFSMSSTDSTYNSTPTSGSTGYAIATCNFQYAHGYSFVSDTGIRNFAAAYLALIIPDAPRSPTPFLCASGIGCYGQPGEQLVH
jgi:hypothetical protein